MAYQSRVRKRVHGNPIRRAPDGSAFKKCESCGISVAIVLADMHECGFNQNTKKKVKTQRADGNVERHQPRSAFRLFMEEEFLKTCEDGDCNLVEKDKRGCERWKNMSKEERQPYVDEADKLDAAYMELLWDEENQIQMVDEEADSAEVGKYDEGYEDYKMYYHDSKTSCGSGLFLSETYDTFDHKALLRMAAQKFH